MKKTTLLLLFFLLGFFAIGQYQAGNILLNGTLIFEGSQSERTNGGTTVEGPKTTMFEIGPGIEFFFSDKMAFGGEINFSTEQEVDSDPGNGLDETIAKTNMTAIAPFFSYYFINEDRFALFGKIGVGFGFGKNTYEAKAGSTTVTNEEELSSFEIAFKPGIAVHLSEKFGMTATIGELGYSSTKSVNGGREDKTSNYGLRLSPSLGFGIYFKLK